MEFWKYLFATIMVRIFFLYVDGEHLFHSFFSFLQKERGKMWGMYLMVVSLQQKHATGPLVPFLNNKKGGKIFWRRGKSLKNEQY